MKIVHVGRLEQTNKQTCTLEKGEKDRKGNQHILFRFKKKLKLTNEVKALIYLNVLSWFPTQTTF